MTEKPVLTKTAIECDERNEWYAILRMGPWESADLADNAAIAMHKVVIDDLASMGFNPIETEVISLVKNNEPNEV